MPAVIATLRQVARNYRAQSPLRRELLLLLALMLFALLVLPTLVWFAGQVFLGHLFIETRRHWFDKRVTHKSTGGVNVLNLVEGEEAIVESPEGAFDPFIVHYAETFIVPAAARSYTVRPHGAGEGQQCATIKAYVRTAP